MNIRRYTVEDKSTCLEIFDSNVPQYFASEERIQFINWLDLSNREAYYVLDDTVKNNKKTIVACGGIFYDSRNNSVGLAWGMVHSLFHGKGYGKHLTKHRLEQLDRQYAGKIQRIETSQHTVAFYEKMGFQTVQFDSNGFGPGLDRYEMIRTILDQA